MIITMALIAGRRQERGRCGDTRVDCADGEKPRRYASVRACDVWASQMVSVTSAVRLKPPLTCLVAFISGRSSGDAEGAIVVSGVANSVAIGE